jgi:alpha-glucosidase (family GH31 glycosyl hydrolase)
LSNNAIPVDVKHLDASLQASEFVSEIDAHSTFGHLESKATKSYFDKIEKRSFILSRSTYSGTGKFA